MVVNRERLPFKRVILLLDDRLTDVAGWHRLQDRHAEAIARMRLMLAQEPSREPVEVWLQIAQEMGLGREVLR